MTEVGTKNGKTDEMERRWNVRWIDGGQIKQKEIGQKSTVNNVPVSLLVCIFHRIYIICFQHYGQKQKSVPLRSQAFLVSTMDSVISQNNHASSNSSFFFLGQLWAILTVKSHTHKKKKKTWEEREWKNIMQWISLTHWSNFYISLSSNLCIVIIWFLFLQRLFLPFLYCTFIFFFILFLPFSFFTSILFLEK